MNWFYLIIGILVTFRLSLMISSETGPAFIFKKLRKIPDKDSSMKEGISCLWCMSVWIGLPVSVCISLLGYFPYIEIPFMWISYSSGSVILNQAFIKE